MEYTYSTLFQEVSEYLTRPEYNISYTKALDYKDVDALEAQETCRTAIQHYLSKTKGIPQQFLNAETAEKLYNDIIAWGPITSFILNGAKEGISEIRVYGPNDISLQQHGQWRRLDNIAFYSSEYLERVKERILTYSDIGMSDMNGFTDRARLPNGSRVAIAQYPNVGASCYMSIRIYNETLFSSDQLVVSDSISKRQDKLIKFLMSARANSAWLGPMTSGKTTSLAAYLPHLPAHWHILTIEDVPEFFLKRRNPSSIVSEIYIHNGEFALTWEEAAAFTLRTAATVVFWGELRHTSSAYRAIENMTTGHRGSGFTGHAGSAEEGIQNLSNRYQEAVPTLDTEIVLQRVSNAIDIIPMIRISPTGKRYMSDISAVTWDKKLKEPKILPIITRRLDRDGTPVETYHGIPGFLKEKLVNWNSVFEEDFKEWEI